MIAAIDRKLLRDIWQSRGQALAICLVIACGAATFVMSVSTLQSLEQARAEYYEAKRFADVFVQVKRAPRQVAERIMEVPGVERVQTRVVAEVNLDVAGMADPAAGRIISLPPSLPLDLNDIHLRDGRFIEPGATGEVLASEAFADAHGLRPGDSVAAIINGRRQPLRIVGIALSPEYIYQIRPGEILPDDRRFGVFWMEYPQIAAAFDLDGAFNDVALSLAPGASEPEVIRRLDEIAARYGGLGAFGRDDHPSHRFISNEIRELRGMAYMVPAIFLGVAAFLLNVVVSRLIRTQREQIAALKAFGYGPWQIGRHYLRFVLLIVIVGVAIGSTVGGWLARNLTHMYTKFFHFPVLAYRLDSWVVLTALGLCVMAGVAATFFAVRGAMRLPPAQAMRPEPPPTFRATLAERLGLQRLFSPAARMVMRQLERRPVKSLVTSMGIATAVAVLILGAYMQDAINYVMDLEYQVAQTQDVTVQFVEPLSGRVKDEVAHLPGVIRGEGFRTVAATIRSGSRSRRVGVLGLPREASLFRLYDLKGRKINVPPGGLVLSAKLAELLDARLGDLLTVEIHEERRPVVRERLVTVIDDFAGLSAYMDAQALGRVMREQDAVSGMHLAVDSSRSQELYSKLKATPQVAGVAIKAESLRSFRDTVAENLLRFRMFNIVFACIIAFGVVYNSVRISLAERSRELATLRVIGFTRAEVSAILLGELALLTAVAIPMGFALGYAFTAVVSQSYNTELFRMPLVIERPTFGFATVVVLLAAAASGLIVRRRIDRLDLVGVLKARE